MEDKRISPIKEYDTPAYPPRKRRWGDRREGRRVRSIPGMSLFTPFIMPTRNDSQNQFEDVIDITNVEKYLDEKHAEGYTDMTILHVILAAYVRIVAERPAVNRFIAGQRIFARNNIECVMTIKKRCLLSLPIPALRLSLTRAMIYIMYIRSSEQRFITQSAQIAILIKPRILLLSSPDLSCEVS